MTQRGLARRYAGALFDVTLKAGTLDRARADLDGVTQLIAGHEELGKVLESPAVPSARKRALMAAILERTGNLGDEVRRLLLMLAEHDRLGLLAEISRSFADRVMKENRMLPAEVVTAVPLGADSRQALASALGRATGSQITLTERVDPAVVGGVVAKVGSVVFDGSVARQVERLRHKLLAEV